MQEGIVKVLDSGIIAPMPFISYVNDLMSIISNQFKDKVLHYTDDTALNYKNILVEAVLRP